MSENRVPGWLVITREEGQEVKIGADITVRVAVARNGRVRLLIQAPRSVPILRDDAVATEPKGVSRDAS